MRNRELWSIVQKHPGYVLIGVLTAHDVIPFMVTKVEVRYHLDRFGMDATAYWKAIHPLDGGGNLYLHPLDTFELEESEQTPTGGE